MMPRKFITALDASQASDRRLHPSNLMEADEPDTSILSHKRARSASPSPSPSLSTATDAMTRVASGSRDEYMQRAPKRLRRSHDIPDYHAPVEAHRLAANNPMNRKMLKRAAKKARRAGRPQVVEGGVMEVDEVNLSNTFFAAPGFTFEVPA